MASTPIEEIKARLDVADLVGQTVQLRRSGRSLKGLCPFHGEKTPSFYVFPETGTWHCFGCGEGGDAFSFLMKRDNLEFVDALRELAARAGVALPAAGPRPAAQEQHQRLYDALEAATLFYQSILAQEGGRAGRDYLDRRAVSEESRQRFALGYAPEGASPLRRYLAERGFTEDEQIAAGVAGRGERGDVFDYLRGRVIFPIRDEQGRVIALAGRTLSDAVQPKYLNTPQTALFDKSGCLYAMDLARAEIRKRGQVVIVEGYLDAIAAHQYGYANVVATMGTAITEKHLLLLRRGGPEIVLALDADEAGQNAALRALEVAERAGGEGMVAVPTRQGRVRYQRAAWERLRVLVLPPGRDPDELLNEDASLWPSLVASALPVVDFVLNRLPARFDLGSGQGKSDAADEALSIIGAIPDAVQRAHYLQRLAQLLHVDEAALAARIRVRGHSRPSAVEEPRHVRVDALEQLVLGLVLMEGFPEVAELKPADFEHPAHRALFAWIGGIAPTPEPAALESQVPAELRDAWDGVLEQCRQMVELSLDRVRQERDVAALELRQRRLLEDHERVASLLTSGVEDPEDRQAWLRRLGELSFQLAEVQRLKRAHGRVGSMVSRYRRAAEVLSG